MNRINRFLSRALGVLALTGAFWCSPHFASAQPLASAWSAPRLSLSPIAVSSGAVAPDFWQSPALLAANTMPTFSGVDSKGRTINSRDYKGKFLIIDFWATWCPPCRQEIPDLIALQQKYPAQLQIIGVSLDENIQKHQKFVNSNKFNYPSLCASEGSNANIVKSFSRVIGDINAIPTTVMVDKQRNIVKVERGCPDKPLAYFESILKKYIK